MNDTQSDLVKDMCARDPENRPSIALFVERLDNVMFDELDLDYRKYRGTKTQKHEEK